MSGGSSPPCPTEKNPVTMLLLANLSFSFKHNVHTLVQGTTCFREVIAAWQSHTLISLS